MDDPNRVSRIKERAALVSIVMSVLLTAAKLVVGILSGSLAVLSEAGNNLADTAATILTYFAVRVAHKPADEEHQFGHGKVEALAALAETGFLFALAVYILVEAIRRLVAHEAEVEASALTFGVLAVSIVLDFWRWRSLKKIAAETRSEALAADALNFASDIVASSLAIAGLLATRFGYPQGDTIAAFAVAVFIAVAGYKLARQTVDTLLDAAPKGLTGPVTVTAKAVPGVIDVESVRLRPLGAEVVGHVGIHVSRTLPLEKVTEIKENVIAAIAREHADVAVTVGTTPVALDDETVLERILLIAAKRHVPVHHIIVQQVDGRTAVSFDVEFDGRMPHGRAHDLASGLERAVRQELGPDIEVETHIEPLEPRELAGHDATAATLADIAATLARHAPEGGEIKEVHSVRVRETPSGLVVNYHCCVDPDLSVDEVHDHVDRLDRKLRADCPKIVRVVGHAEPLQISR